MPPSSAAEQGRRRRSPAVNDIGFVLVQLYAALQNVPEAGEDRLVCAARRFLDPLPIAVARTTGEAPNEPCGEYAAWHVPLSRVTREAPRELAPDGNNRSTCDMRIGAGQDDLTHDHRQPPSDGRALKAVVTIKFVLNVSSLEIILSNRAERCNVKNLSHCMVCGAH
jgi:hypothetical protein